MIKHIAFIMDGNRRWAKEKHLPTLIGHDKGINGIEKIVTHAQNLGIPYITFWAFSTENWQRSKDEVTYLLNLFRKLFKGKMLKKLLKNGGKITVIGNLSAFPEDIQKEIFGIIDQSKNNTGIHITIALNYGGREEIVQAVQKIISDKLNKADITVDVFSQYLYTSNQPDPDLIVRTGGSQRLSGYLPWQSIYSELYFTDSYWPDFDEKAFDKAIEEYQNRERRFGK
jgi:undecaprenyl diphosphate synthase